MSNFYQVLYIFCNKNSLLWFFKLRIKSNIIKKNIFVKIIYQFHIWLLYDQLQKNKFVIIICFHDVSDFWICVASEFCFINYHIDLSLSHSERQQYLWWEKIVWLIMKISFSFWIESDLNILWCKTDHIFRDEFLILGRNFLFSL